MNAPRYHLLGVQCCLLVALTSLFGNPLARAAHNADVWVALSNGLETLPAGGEIVFSIRAGNFGSGDPVTAQLDFSLPEGLDSPGWTCEAHGIATCPGAGAGDILADLELPPGDWVEFAIPAAVKDDEGALIATEATVSLTDDATDTDLSNNTSSLSQAIGLFTAGFEALPPVAIRDPLDLDGDGWIPANGDCCEDTGTCPDPFLVNPGAFEILGNGINDDCDVTTTDVDPPACSTTAKYGGVTAQDLAGAIELCRLTTAAEPRASRKWGLISAALENADGTTPDAPTLAEMQDSQTAVISAWGTGGVGPVQGATLAGMSSGWMRDKDDPGYIIPFPGTSFGNESNPPADFLAANGGSLPNPAHFCLGTCPAGSGAFDSVSLHLKIRVPTNARGFSYEWRFFSAEFSTWLCSSFNDFSLALLDSSFTGLPADKNIAFDALGNPMSVNNAFFEICALKDCVTCPEGTGPLAGTGYEDDDQGGGTVWLTTSAPVVPGEIIDLRLMIFDVSDNAYDSLLLLDGFQWLTEQSAVGTGPTP